MKDRRAKAIILYHVDNMEDGKMGKLKPVGNGIYEKKIDYGPGYRLYFCKRGNDIILLLCGGVKSTQQADIDEANEIKKGLRWTNERAKN